MKLIRKDDRGGEGGKEPEVFHYPWEAGMAALASGEYDVHGNRKEDRGPDQPGAQSPAPGVDPIDGKEEAVGDSRLTNMTRVAAPANVSEGLPKDSAPPVAAKAPSSAKS